MKTPMEKRQWTTRRIGMAVVALFGHVAVHAQTSTNTATGAAFGTDYAALATATSIFSASNATGTLSIQFGGTTNLLLRHDVAGSVVIDNAFDRFTLSGEGTNAALRANDYAALAVFGGTNLAVNGGLYVGGTTPVLSGNDNVGFGGVFSNVQSVAISQARFTGGTSSQPSTSTAIGMAGIVAIDSGLVFADDGSDSAKVTGGNGSIAFSSSGNANTMGGIGLLAENSSVVVSNGTFTGGRGGPATVTGGGQGLADGGAAIAASASDVTIYKGTFTGGAAGQVLPVESNTPKGGAALVAQDGSSVAIYGGAFAGETNAAAIASTDSDLLVQGGTFKSGGTGVGLYSQATAGRTNHVDLLGGTFKSLWFDDAGVQLFTAGTNLVVQKDIRQTGGRVVVDNLSDAALSDISVSGGTMSFPSNSFMLASGGHFTLGDVGARAEFASSLGIASNAVFDVGLGRLDASNLVVEADGELRIAISSGTNGLVVAGTVDFQTNASIAVDASLAGLHAGTNEFVLVTATNGIAFSTTNATASVSGRTSFDGASLVDGGRALSFQFSTLALKDYWGASGQFAKLADELDLLNNAAMMAKIDAINDPAVSGPAAERTYFTVPNTFQTALQGLYAAVGQSVSRGTEFREMLRLSPPGAHGPQIRNEWRGWAKYYGQFYNRDAQGLNPRYDATLHGGALGADRSIGNNLLVGVSGGAGSYHIENGRNSSAQQDVSAYHGAVYATLGSELAYLDAGAAYGVNQVETHAGVPFELNGEYDARIAGAWLGGGYGFKIGQNGLALTTEAGVRYARYEQDAYTETSTVAVPRQIDKFDADSLRSDLGLNLAMTKAVFQPDFSFKAEGRVHWMHEYNTEPGSVDFRLAGGSNDYQIDYPLLDEDLFSAGVGLSFFNTKRGPQNILLRLDLDELFGQGFNSLNLSAKVVYAF